MFTLLFLSLAKKLDVEHICGAIAAGQGGSAWAKMTGETFLALINFHWKTELPDCLEFSDKEEVKIFFFQSA